MFPIAFFQPDWWWLLLTLGVTVLLVRTREFWRRTTLAAPVGWLAAAVAGLGTTHVIVPLWAPNWDDEGLRYAGATLLFAPPLAILGAKRPQDRGWQWVVVCLLITLWIPIVQWKLQSGGGRFTVFAAWTLFHAVLIVVGLLAYLPTARAGPSLLYAVGQALLLAPTCLSASFLAPWYASLGIVALSASAMTLLCWPVPRRSRSGAERLWIRFRNTFGAFWAIRVMQRINEGGVHGHWGFLLAWDGLVDPETQLPLTASADQLEKLEQAMRTQLRRFVTPEWIERELALDEDLSRQTS